MRPERTASARGRGGRARRGAGPGGATPPPRTPVEKAPAHTATRVAAALPLFAAILWVAAASAAEPRRWTGPARGPQPSEGPFSYDGAYDLGALWREAQAAPWGEEDAVILLEKHEETWTSDGRRIEYRHRVVRIATDLGSESYADLRVPYDSLSSTLTVLSLRTFRDAQWIESGPTAQVETTPDALERAPDYGWLRERILMHDGVEVPCLLETAWRIEDRIPYRSGIWGQEIFRRVDPVVRAEFAVFSSGGAMRAEGRNGAGEGTRVEEAPPGLAGTRWRLDRLQPAASLGPDPGADFPCVTWSSWAGWPEFGAWMKGQFADPSCFTAAHRDTLRARLRGAETETEVARRIAALVGERTRHLATPERWWGKARWAAGVYDDAYGTSLDRARLAAGLLREAGLSAEPVFSGRSFADCRGSVAGLDRFQPVRILVSSASGSASGPGSGAASGSASIPGFASVPDSVSEILGIFDPASSTFEAGAGPLSGRVVWRPAMGDEPDRFQTAAPSEPVGRSSLSLDLHFDREAKAWIGNGVYAASGVFAPYGKMEGLGEQSAEWLGSIVSDVLPGTEVAAYNLSVFEARRVIAGVTVKLTPPEADGQGRIRLDGGDLRGAIRSLLPGEVPMHRGAIAHSIYLPGPVAQEVRLRWILPESETLRLPEPARLRNATGSFDLGAKREGEAVTLTRSLNLTRTEIRPEAWPELRALLQAEAHDRNRVIVYRPAGGG